MQSVVAFLLIGSFLLLVPGYLTIVALVKQHKGRLGWTLPEAIFTCIAVSVFLVSWLALLLAELSSFSIVWIVVGVAAYTAALLAIFRGHLWQDAISFSQMPRPNFGLELVGVALIAILAVLLFVQRFDYIIGGLDSGTYANTGINIAKTGSIVTHDPIAIGLSDAEAELFFGKANKPWVFGSRLIGFYLADLKSGSVQPQGFHLYPVWIAILYSLGGVRGGLLATPLFGILGVLGLYFVGKRLFSSQVGLLASFLLTICIAQIWFSRVPLAEVAVQFFLLAGIYFFTLTVDYESKFLGLLAGVSLGMVHLTKIEVILLPISVLGFLWLMWAARKFRREYWYVLAGYLIMLVHAILHAVFAANVYASEVVHNTFLPMINSILPGSVGVVSKALWKQSITADDAARGLILPAAFILMALLSWLVLRLTNQRVSTVPQTTKGIIGSAVFVLVAGLAAYAWFVRPIFPPIDPNLSVMEKAVQVNNRESLIRLGWYISPLGVLFGLAGLAKAVTLDMNRKTVFFFVIALPTTFLLLFNNFITPVHFWAGRRFVYIVIPLFLLLAAYALSSLKRTRGFNWKADIVPMSIAIALVLTLLRPVAPYVFHLEYGGAVQQLADLTGTFPEESIVLFGTPESNAFSVPLKYGFGKDVLALNGSALSDVRLHDLIKRWQNNGKQVFWVTASKDSANLPTDLKLNYLGSKIITLSEGSGSLDRLPPRPTESITNLDIYEIISNLGYSDGEPR